MTERHPTNAEIELFAIGADDEIAFEGIASHLADCDRCAGLLVQEAQLEDMLTEIAGAARFCPGCMRVSNTERCDHCGVARSPGGFLVERVLVQSSHGRLYLARDPQGRAVALKELVFTQIPNAQALVAFEKEAKLLQELDHPGVPRFVSSFSEGDGVHTRLYLAQEFVEGASLMTRLSSHRFTEKEAIDIARRLLEILEYLHGLSPKIIHRDIKPANILQRRDGSIVLVDFGSARDFSMTGGATLVGTFGYIPPEQLVGMSDETSDLYALGASLAHLLTRRPPWQLGPGKLNDLSPSFRRFVSELMAQDPSERFPTAIEAKRALDRIGVKPPMRKWIPLAAIAAVTIGAGVSFSALRHAKHQHHVPVVMAPPPVVHATPIEREIAPPPVVQLPVPMVEPEEDRPVLRPKRGIRDGEDVKEARVLFSIGTRALLEGRLADAKESLTECIDVAPNYPDCHRALGVLYAQLDDTAGSVKHYKKYIKLRPNAVEAPKIRKLIKDVENGGRSP